MIDNYHREREMILKENESRAISSSQFTVNEKKTTQKNHII